MLKNIDLSGLRLWNAEVPLNQPILTFTEYYRRSAALVAYSINNYLSYDVVVCLPYPTEVYDHRINPDSSL